MKADAFTWLWIAWVLLFCVFETAALIAGHGTLSAHVWYLLDRYTLARLCIFALFGWLILHFFIDRRIDALRWSVLDDAIVLILSALLGWRTRRR